MTDAKVWDPKVDRFDPGHAGLRVEPTQRGWVATGARQDVRLVLDSPIGEWSTLALYSNQLPKSLRIPYDMPHDWVWSLLYLNEFFGA
jgi:hypothetical protein